MELEPLSRCRNDCSASRHQIHFYENKCRGGPLTTSEQSRFLTQNRGGWAIICSKYDQSKIGIFLKFALCPAKILVFLKNFTKNMLCPL